MLYEEESSILSQLLLFLIR